jgi:hypothetical protein
MIRQAAPIVQSLLLMLIYLLLPYVLVFSGFAIRTVVFMAAVIFAVYYWTPLWAITYWLDNNLMDAMAPAALVTGEPYLTGDIMSFVTGSLYLMVPVVWLTLLGWSGYSIGAAVAGFVSTQSQAAQTAASKGADMVRSTGMRAAKRFKG